MENLDLDTFLEKFRKKDLTAEQYEWLRKNTKTFPYVHSKKWVAQISKKDDCCYIEPFATGMSVTGKFIDSDTGKTKIRIKYYNGVSESERDFESSILNIQNNKLLYDYGIRYDEKDARRVIKYISKSERAAPVFMTYNQLGWGKFDNEKIFKTGYAISKNGQASGLIYDGTLDLQASGTLQAWIDMVKNEVLPSTPMTLVMLLGFASPILSYLNQKYDLGVMLWNLSNESSKGKTTSAMLAASIFSNPVFNKGLAITFYSTENALLDFISNAHGHPIIIDEVAISNCNNFTRLMYTICNGRSKMKLNGDSVQKQVKIFSSVIITTAEFDLIDEDAPNGIKARVYELKDSLTTSAENSDIIKKTVIENYGVAGNKFLEYVLNHNNIFEDYENCKKALICNCAEKKQLFERICSKFAVITTTAKYVNAALGLEIDIDKISQYLLTLEKNISESLKPEERLIEIVKQDIARNNSRYMIDSSVPCSPCFGAIKTENGYSEIQITDSAFKEIMRNNNLTGWQHTLKQLKQRGILQSEQDRIYKRVVLLKEVGRQKCYCFRIKNVVKKEIKEVPVTRKINIEHHDNIKEYLEKNLSEIDIDDEMVTYN